ncbi:growth hormone-regulated tbc protein [Anaeramoeba ignava]|uniref:Growth hormone-regulated tbc protein n=1 Tax=Anaeramoeba ignava TaxID=1746090 RepID=A0A9Q0R636_ANAIG|nr:growth hormone-regulated tbc protein [Anaeramoeba ignava]
MNPKNNNNNNQSQKQAKDLENEKTGFLTKLGGVVKNWKNRFFVLNDGVLLYFVAKEDCTPRGQKTEEERNIWVDAIDKSREKHLKRIQVEKRLIEVDGIVKPEEEKKKVMKKWSNIVNQPLSIIQGNLEKLKVLARKGVPSSLRGKIWMNISGAVIAKEKKLRTVLLAFSSHRNDVQYAQGMAFIAALFLLYLSTEDAFWLLNHVMSEYRLIEIYKNNVYGLRKLTTVLNQLIQAFLPKVYKKFEEIGFLVEFIAGSWLPSLFLSNSALWFGIRFWDMFIFEHDPEISILSFTLAIFHRSQNILSKVLSVDQIFAHFKILRTVKLEDTCSNKKYYYFNIDNIISSASNFQKKELFQKIVKSEIEKFDQANVNEEKEDEKYLEVYKDYLL